MCKGRSKLGVARGQSSVTMLVAAKNIMKVADLALVESKVTEVGLRARNNETILRLAYVTTFNANTYQHETGPSSAFALPSCFVYDGMYLSSVADFTHCVLRSCDDLECLSSVTDNWPSPLDIMFFSCSSW